MKSYKTMYEKFVEVAKEKLFFRPMTVSDEDILLSGNLDFSNGRSTFHPVQQHLTCFTGGMLAIAGKIFNRPQDVEVGAKLTDGCVWAYRNTPTGIMPETFTAVDCGNHTACTWDKEKWHHAINPFPSDDTSLIQEIQSQKLSPGFAHVGDARYLLRYEKLRAGGNHTNCNIDLRQSSQFSSCTESVEIATGLKMDGRCSSQSWRTRRQILHTLHFEMC
jgi:mannosyl-oligosaccharide alpha-1,2-mannosidase